MQEDIVGTCGQQLLFSVKIWYPHRVKRIALEEVEI